MSSEEIVRAAFQARRERLIGQSLNDWRASVPQLILAFRLLTTEQGQRIAEDIWRDFDPKEDGYLLAHLGASVPGALATIQEELVERRVFYPSFLYLGASNGIAKRLIEMVSPPTIEESRNLLLLCRAWISKNRRKPPAFRHGDESWVAR
jgi:hypothetical protein